MDEAWLIPWSCGPFIGTFWINQAELSSFHIGFSQFIWYEMGYFHFTSPRTYVGYSSPSAVSQTWNTDTDVTELKLFNMTGTVSHSGRPPGPHWFTKASMTNDHKKRQNKRKSPSHGLKARRSRVKMFLRAFFWGLLRKDPSMLLSPTSGSMSFWFVAPLRDSGYIFYDCLIPMFSISLSYCIACWT